MFHTRYEAPTEKKRGLTVHIRFHRIVPRSLLGHQFHTFSQIPLSLPIDPKPQLEAAAAAAGLTLPVETSRW